MSDLPSPPVRGSRSQARAISTAPPPQSQIEFYRIERISIRNARMMWRILVLIYFLLQPILLSYFRTPKLAIALIFGGIILTAFWGLENVKGLLIDRIVAKSATGRPRSKYNDSEEKISIIARVQFGELLKNLELFEALEPAVWLAGAIYLVYSDG